MIRAQFFFAALNDAVNDSKRSFNSAFSTAELIRIAIIGGAVAVIILVWAFFFRKRPDEIRYPLPQSRKEEAQDEEREEREDGTVRRKRRRRRRPHRPRNATLSETGGLPPHRPEDQPPPY
jgi:hypothetical protein